MTTPARIRWSAGAEKWVTAWFGSVGTVDPHLFSIIRPMAPDDEWALTCGLPGFAGKASYGDGPDTLKTEAERWLAQFAASLGASFPAAPEVATVGEQACSRCHGSGRDGRYRCPACNRDGSR